MSAALAGLAVALAVLLLPGRRWRSALPVPPAAPPSVGAPVVQIADSIELIALAMRSGCGIVEALDLVSDQLDDITGVHLRTVCAALRWGMSEEEAWGAVPPDWAPAAQALSLAAGAGVAPGDLLRAAAADVRRREEHRIEAATERMGVKVVLPLGLTFLPAFILTAVIPLVLALTSQIFPF
ncbi:Flp pilus assembly protein TadB [Kineosphaera limosa]|uniref:Type II secretion system protein GspF domain-containing protein n=1 Tax=Kineosphaera limosa NBRC 100340 TaxID=1184609 RepID=K6WG34_9MICO|nr:type II secretion system F family protein [Kineosphaera limosa]NYE01641.1 Flp pilus assembly protein TadB [Kineosphaera limosa]GAB98240.1 hypothetical protein KILIM_116_00040 [Kineosphaera limosa NBRC 100340]